MNPRSYMQLPGNRAGWMEKAAASFMSRGERLVYYEHQPSILGQNSGRCVLRRELLIDVSMAALIDRI